VNPSTAQSRSVTMPMPPARSCPCTNEGVPFDLAITLCDKAHAVCPVVPGAKKMVHHGFADPHLTPGTEEEVLDGYRKVRDDIAAWIETTFR